MEEAGGGFFEGGNNRKQSLEIETDHSLVCENQKLRRKVWGGDIPFRFLKYTAPGSRVVQVPRGIH